MADKQIYYAISSSSSSKQALYSQSLVIEQSRTAVATVLLHMNVFLKCVVYMRLDSITGLRFRE